MNVKKIRAVYLLWIMLALIISACGAEELIQVGKPAVACVDKGHASISIPVSESIHGRENVFLSYDGQIYRTNWSTSNADFVIPVPPGGGEDFIGLHVEVLVRLSWIDDYDQVSEDFGWRINFPNCDTYSSGPSDSQSGGELDSVPPTDSLADSSDLDGAAEIEGITCSADGIMTIHFRFPEATNGHVFGEYEASVNGENFTFRGRGNNRDGNELYFRGLAPENGSFPNIVLKALSDGDIVLNTDTYQMPICHNFDGTPVILNSFCVSSQQLVIVLEFEQAVTFHYTLFVDGVSFEIDESALAQPSRLFFLGAAPPGGGAPRISVYAFPGATLVLEVTDYYVPQCNFESQNDGGGDDGYTPPSY